MIRARALAPLLALFACAELGDIGRDVCGNQVVDLDEDCDTFVDEALQETASGPLSCAPAGDARECAYVCDAAAGERESGACPAGWACGQADGVCRRPSLTVEPSFTQSIDQEPSDVLYADFDGDGSEDLALFRSGEVNVRYAVPGGGFGTGLREPLGLIALARTLGFGPAAGDIDGSGGVDLVAPTEQGLLALRGREDQSFAPISHPVAQFPLLEEAAGAASVVQVGLPPAPGGAAGFMAYVAGSTHAVDRPGMPPEVVTDIVIGDVHALPQFGLALSTRVEAPTLGRHLTAIGDVDGDGAPVLAIGFPGHPEILLLKAYRDPLGFGRVRLLDRFELPGPLESQLVFRDYDGDGTLDLIADFVLPGTGPRAGALHVVAVPMDPAELSRPPAELARELFRRTRALNAAIAALDDPLTPVREGQILAQLDVNDDGFTDFVVSDAVHARDPNYGRVGSVLSSVATGTASHDTLAYQLWPLGSTPFSEVTIGDVNFDRRPDVLAATRDASGIDVFLHFGGLLFNRGRIETDRAPFMIRVGDFDGDFVGDVSFFERSGGTARLSVAFGRMLSVPSAPRSTGEIPAPTGAYPVYEPDLDAIGDLIITSTAAGPRDLFGIPRTLFLPYVFKGSTDQRLRAALDFGGGPAIPPPPVGALLLGRFSPPSQGLDLVAIPLFEGGDRGNGQGLGLIRPAFGVPSNVLTGRAFDGLGKLIVPLFGTGCAYRCDYGAVVSLPAIETDGRTTPGDVALRFGCGLDRGVEVLRPMMSADPPRAACGRSRLPGHLPGRVARAESADIDGNGQPDLLLVHAPDGLGTSGVSIAWDARIVMQSSAGSRPESAELQYAALDTLAQPGSMVEDAALADVDLDGRLDVVVLADTGVWWAHARGDRKFARAAMMGGMALPSKPSAAPAGDGAVALPIQPMVERGRVFADDVNDDGILDVVIQRPHSVEVLTGGALAPGSLAREAVAADEPVTE